MRPSSSSLLAVAALLASGSCVLGSGPTANSGLFAHAAVASAHACASKVGAAVLAEGGNAVDAAIATALALGVVRPEASGIGGGGFMVYYRAKDGFATAIDFRERAPAGASRDMYIRDGKVDPSLSIEGGLAVAVPGEVAGFALAHRLYGRLSWPKLFSGALHLALDGVSATPSFAGELRWDRKLLTRFPFLADGYLDRAGAPVRAGTILDHPQLAATLDAIARGGPSAFYSGPIARDIAAAVRAAGGILTADDLAGYRPVERPVLRGQFAGVEILTMPPPSSGGVALIEILNILAALPGGLPNDTIEYHHMLVEAMKQGFADRAAFLGDPDFVKVPVEQLTSPTYAHMVALKIRPDRALPPERCGFVPPPDDHGTSHLCVIDQEGNAVAMTLTINTEFGSKVEVPGRGIVLNNEMDDFSAAPGARNVYGLVQGTANAIAPGKCPLSSMTPVILLSGRRVAMVVGGAGGPHIISATLQVILNVLHRGMDSAAAVDAPRLHHQWSPNVVFLEPAASEALAKGLIAKGDTVVRRSGGSVVQIIRRTPQGLDAAADPRKGGRPAGF